MKTRKNHIRRRRTMKGGSQELVDAVYINNLRHAKELLKAGDDVNTVISNGSTVLYIAASKGFYFITELLLEYGAEVNMANNEGETPLYVASLRGHGNVVKLLLENGGNIYKKNNVGVLPFFAAFYKANSSKNDNELDRYLNVMELLLQKGADINKEDTHNNTSLLVASHFGNLKVAKFLIEKGADINKKNKNGVAPFWHAVNKAISASNDYEYNKYLEVMELLLKNGADINIDSNLITPLHKATEYENLKVVEFLIKKGADINKADNNGYTPLYNTLSKGNVNLSKLLLENGATITDVIKKDMNNFDPDIQALLGYTAKESKEMWKGWSRADSEALDTIFDSENANNYAHCPFCLKYIERSDACMYMTHDCRKGGVYYNKKLYNFFKNSMGLVSWCTICGRPCIGHHHCVLSLPDNPSKDLMTKADGMIIEGDPFEKDCSMTSGGGGLPEKLARFRMLREFAKELEEERSGIITEEEAMDALVKQAWIAPSISKPRLKKILETKTWNFPHSNFKTRINGNNNAGNAPNVVRPEPNVSDPNLQPIVYESGTNTLYGDEGVKVVQFRHRQEDDSINNHENDRIALDNLEEWLKNATKNFGEDSFGYCYMYPACKAKLYPSELKGLVPDERLKDYQKKFNKKFKVASGGGTNNIFIEANDAVCVIPPKKGGRRKTRRRRRVFKK